MKKKLVVCVVAALALCAAPAVAQTDIGTSGCYAEGWHPTVISETQTTATLSANADVRCAAQHWTNISACYQVSSSQTGPFTNVSPCRVSDPEWGFGSYITYGMTVSRPTSGQKWYRMVGRGFVYPAGMTAAANSASDVSHSIGVN